MFKPKPTVETVGYCRMSLWDKEAATFGKDGGERGEYCGKQCPDKPVSGDGHAREARVAVEI